MLDGFDTEIKTPGQLGIFIKNRRLELGLDQASLAHRAGISRVWLLEIEKGKPGVSIAVILRVLTALKASLLISETPSRRTAPSATSAADLNKLLNSLRRTKQ